MERAMTLLAVFGLLVMTSMAEARAREDVGSLDALRAATPAAPASHSCDAFEELFMTLERNATDGDTEVVLFAKGQDEGLKSLVVRAPNGRVVAAFAGDRRGVGLREFHLESAEPPDLGAVLASFPQGWYSFDGKSVGGDCLRGRAFLSHQLAPATQLLTPEEDEEVALSGLVLSWAPVAGTERYVIELNNEDSGSEFTFEVFPPVTSLPIPAALLQPNSEYQFAVGVKTPNANLTFVELTFFTGR